MSLKAKLEAVIYAAEEPVTLAQLALLFTADALEWKAEQVAAAAAEAAQADASSPESEPLPLIPEAEAEQAETEVAAAGGVELQEQVVPEGGATALDAGCESAESVAAASEQTGVDQAEKLSAENGESELKRQARQRDREVRNVLRTLLDELIAEYEAGDRGIEIREVAGGYRMATKPECHDAVRGFVKSLKPPLKLSLPALETLAVIAYKQPVTAPEVNEIRGVDSSGVFGSLLSRKLIATAGRKQVLGRPILYKTTREFLLRFGLKDVSELPSMEEFEKLAASELEEPESQPPTEAGAPAAEPEPGAAAGESIAEVAETGGAASNLTEPAAEAVDAATEETAAAPAAQPSQPVEPSQPAETEQLAHD
jgi:segregation and condensation protein B